MKLIDERQMRSSTSITGRSWRAILGALVWIGGGIIALLVLCTFGPTLVAYVTAAHLPIVVLTPLVSTIIAGWDVGGLLLIIFGAHRLIRVYRSRGDR